AFAPFAAVVIVAVWKFAGGAWLTVIVIPVLVAAFSYGRRYYDRLWGELGDPSQIDLGHLERPVVVVPLLRLDRVAQKGLRLALSLTDDVRAVQVLTEEMLVEYDLRSRWPDLVERPGRSAGLAPPQLSGVR